MTNIYQSAIAGTAISGATGATGKGFKIFTYADSFAGLVGNVNNYGEFGLVKGGELYLYAGSGSVIAVAHFADSYIPQPGYINGNANIAGGAGASLTFWNNSTVISGNVAATALLYNPLGGQSNLSLAEASVIPGATGQPDPFGQITWIGQTSSGLTWFGGGGGGSDGYWIGSGYAGGSGIVIVRYPV